MPGRMNKQRQRGFSLVEMMVGLTVGMIVTAGAVVMATQQLADHRRLVLETQVQQDLRAAADLLLRDMRRAGFWVLPENGVWSEGLPLQRSAYGAVEAMAGNDGLTYDYSRADNRTARLPSFPEDNAVDPNREQFGFRLRNGTLQFLLGGRWQPLTDPGTLNITGFNIQVNTQDIPLDEFCPKPCPAGAVCDPFIQQVRHVNVRLVGEAVHDANVVRSVTLSTRVRNDAISGSCPA